MLTAHRNELSIEYKIQLLDSLKIVPGNGRRVVIAGGSGMIGRACSDLLRTIGYRVIVLSRRSWPGREDIVQWSPATQKIERNVINGAHAIVNLTGASIADHRWTSTYKKELYDSRVVPAKYINKLVAEAEDKPKVYLGASGIGVYGDSGAEIMREADQSTERGFLVDLADAWESAHSEVSIDRQVILRIGVVLSASGGFYQRMQLPASFGIYPVFGRGDQFLSWIHVHDLVSCIAWAIGNESVSGPVNVVADQTLTYRAFSQAHRAVRGGFGIIPGLPRFIANILFGEMAGMLFESCNVSNEKLAGLGFQSTFPDVTAAISDLRSS